MGCEAEYAAPECSLHLSTGLLVLPQQVPKGFNLDIPIAEEDFPSTQGKKCAIKSQERGVEWGKEILPI